MNASPMTEDELFARGILPLALDVHMAVHGTSDGLSECTAIVAYLQKRIAEWEPSHPTSSTFDLMVKALVLSAIAEWEAYELAQVIERRAVLCAPGGAEPVNAWNTCAKCSQLVDCDDVHDGSEVVCLGCSAVNVVVEAQDGSFELVLATRDSDAEPEA